MSAPNRIRVSGRTYHRVAAPANKKDPHFEAHPQRVMQLLNYIRVAAEGIESEFNNYLSNNGELPYAGMKLKDLLERAKNSALNMIVESADEAMGILKDEER
jgi:hypothetical protein